MAGRKELIRVGDIVQIREPQFFVRTKYEKSFDYYVEQVRDHRQEDIQKMMDVICRNKDGLGEMYWSKASYNLWNHIVNGIASYEMERGKRDGNPKLIETTPIPAYTYKCFVVYDVSHKFTGSYQTGDSGYDSSTGEAYSESPALIDRKCHRILSITSFDSSLEPDIRMQIEDIYVKFIGTKTVDTPKPVTYLTPRPTQAELDEPWFGDKEE